MIVEPKDRLGVCLGTLRLVSRGPKWLGISYIYNTPAGVE